MKSKMLILLAIVSCLLLVFLASCGGGDKEDSTKVYRGDDDADDDVLTDDTATDDDDTGDDSDDSVSDDSDDTDHWDDDSTDDTGITDDTDDDVVDDTSDDDLEPGIYGFVVGQNDEQTRAFFAVVRGGVMTQKVVPFATDICLLGIDYLPSANFGVAVGEDEVNSVGTAYTITGESLDALSLPFISDSWKLENVSVSADGVAYMVGQQSDMTGTNGIVFELSEGTVTQMTLPDISTDWVLKSISFYSESKGWAVGYDSVTDQAVVLGFNGIAWETQTVPAAANMAGLVDVDAPSAFYAVAVGTTRDVGNTSSQGYSLGYISGNWVQTFLFPDDGTAWYFTKVDMLAEDEAYSFVIKWDQLEQWAWNGAIWNRTTKAQTFDTGSVVSGLSLVGTGNGLIGVRNFDGVSGSVLQIYDSAITTISDSTTTMGNVYDVIAIQAE